jgi:ABC-type dipeptide/oligopeptide/nickel transport system ATPase component
MFCRNAQKRVDTFLKSLGILLPRQIMKKYPHGI